MAHAITGLADGDVAVTIDGESRTDEIGSMARGLLKLRDAAIARSTLLHPMSSPTADETHAARSKVIIDGHRTVLPRRHHRRSKV